MMRRDRSSRYVTSAKDAVGHRSKLLNRHRRPCNSRNGSSNRGLLSNREIAVRNNVKHDTFSRSSASKNDSNHSKPRASVLQRQHDRRQHDPHQHAPHRHLGLNRNRSQNTSAHRKRKSNNSSRCVDSRNRLNVGSKSRKASVLQRQHDLHRHLVLNRNRSRNTNVRRKRRSKNSCRSNSRSRSAVILVRAKARSHKPKPRITRIRSGFKSGFAIRVIRG